MGTLHVLKLYLFVGLKKLTFLLTKECPDMILQKVFPQNPLLLLNLQNFPWT